jgi:peptidyl-prolyl cis-trans isomerase SurA
LIADGVAAMVNDAIITINDIRTMTRQAEQLLEQQFARQPEELNRRLAEIRADATEMLVRRQLILHEFKTAGYNVPESVIEDSIHDRVKRDYGDRVTFLNSIRAEGMTDEVFRQRAREEFIVYIMHEKEPRPGNSHFTPANPRLLRAAQNQLQRRRPGQTAHDLLTKPPGDKGETKELASEILRKITEGAPFEEMAKIHTDGPQRASGGDRGWLSRTEMDKELADAAFALKPGEHSPVIDLPGACWLVRVEERRAAHVKPLADVRDSIERDLRIEENKRRETKWIDRLKQKSVILYFP